MDWKLHPTASTTKTSLQGHERASEDVKSSRKSISGGGSAEFKRLFCPPFQLEYLHTSPLAIKREGRQKGELCK